MDKSIIGIIVALGVSFFILYTRKENWMKEIVVWFACLALLATGVLGLIFTSTEFKANKMFFCGFCVPIIYWIFDRIFKKISESIHGRDFILTLIFSYEIDDSLGAENRQLKTSDYLFSIGLLIIIVLTLLTGIIKL